MRQFRGIRPRDEAITKFKEAGWELRSWQTGGDFEDFVRAEADRNKALLLVDFALGRFLYSENPPDKILSHNNAADDNPVFNAILDSLYGDEVK